jgi:hypothetical protein
MVGTAATSFLMVWGPVIFGLPDHRIRTYRILEALPSFWLELGAFVAVVALCSGCVSLYRRDFLGLVGVVSGLIVLARFWYGPVVVV